MQDVIRKISHIIHNTTADDPQFRWESSTLHCAFINRHKLWSGTRKIIVVDTIEGPDTWSYNVHAWIVALKLTTYTFMREQAITDILADVDRYCLCHHLDTIQFECIKQEFARYFLNWSEPSDTK